MFPKRFGLQVVLSALYFASTLWAQAKPGTEPRKDLVSYAGPMEPLDLPKLVNGSEVVVVAEVTKLLDSPGEYLRGDSVSQAKLYAAEVNVREVLKGNISLGKMVVGGMMPVRPSNRKDNGPLKTNSVRIFFLTRQQNSWRFADPFYGALIAAPVTPRPRVGSTSDKVMEQLLAALQSELVSTDDKRLLLSYMRALSDARIVPALRSELEKSVDEPLTYALLSELILRNDAAALARAQKTLATSNSKYVGVLFYSLARLNRPELLPAIIAGLHSENRALRWNAATALADSRLPEAEPPLLALLDDPDRNLVTQVMASLASKYNQPEWGPSWIEDERWDDMLQHWRQFRESRHANAGR